MKVGQVVITLYVMYFLSHEFSARFFGQYSYLIAELHLASYIAKAGFDVLILKEKHPRKLLRITLPTYLCISLIVLCISTFAFVAIGINAFSVYCYSLTLVLSELIRRSNQTSSYVFYTGFFQYAIQLALFFWCATTNVAADPQLIIFLSTLIPILTLVIGFRKVLIKAIRAISSLSWQHVGATLKLSLSQLAFNVTAIMNDWLGIYLLAFYCQFEQVAIYTAAKRIINGLALPLQVLNINFMNPIARALNSFDKLSSTLKGQRRGYFILFFVTLVFSIPVGWLLPELVDISDDSLTELSIVYLIMLGGLFYNIITGPTFLLSRLLDSSRITAWVTIAISLSCYFIGVIFVHKVDTATMAVTAVLSLGIVNTYLMWFVHRATGLFIYAKP